MKRNYQLDKASERPRSNQGRLAEIEQMPDDKVAMLYACAAVSEVICDECGEETWLIGASGYNSADSCHHCGTEYMVVG